VGLRSGLRHSAREQIFIEQLRRLSLTCWSRLTLKEATMKSSVYALVATLIFAVVFATFSHSIPASGSAGADTLRQLEADFMKATAERGSAGYMSYYAEDAAELPNGAEIIQGKNNISKTMNFLDNKDNKLTWTPVYAEMAASRDLGYTYGNYEFHSKDKDGEATVEHGKYVSIWEKQSDGSWKVVMDMGNSSPNPK
jgi:ketosteroid isomerase-like protein